MVSLYALAVHFVLLITQWTELHGQIIYANPPYAIGAKNGCAGIEACLRKLVCGDVRERSCTLIALLPALPHTDWYAEFVDRCHELYMLTGSLAFPNLFMHPPPSREGYLWVCRSYILCVWRPEPAPEKPVAPHRLEVPPLSRNHPAGEVHLRCCSHCGRIRVLPRHASPIIFEIPIDVFVCSRIVPMRGMDIARRHSICQPCSKIFLTL